MEKQTSSLVPPIYTGNIVEDRKNLNRWIRTYGKQVGASNERVNAVLHVADAVLRDTAGVPWPEELFTSQAGLRSHFEGSDSEYLFMELLVDGFKDGEDPTSPVKD